MVGNVVDVKPGPSDESLVARRGEDAHFTTVVFNIENLNRCWRVEENGHSAVISSLVISESEQDVMLIFGGFTPFVGKKQNRRSKAQQNMEGINNNLLIFY